MSKLTVESVLEFMSEFITENGDRGLKKLWKNEKKEEMEKMLKKLVSKAKKSVKPKKVKDPEAPKKKSAWILFCEQERPKVKAELGLPPKEVFAELGKRWKALDEEEKEPFNEAAKEAKVKYTEDMKSYVPKEGVTERKKRGKKDKNAPKGAKSAWIFFSAAERKKLAKKKMDSKEVMAELGARWKKIKDTKKADKYKEMAKEDKKRYDAEMENYTPPEEKEEEEIAVDSDSDSEKEEMEVEEEEVETEKDSESESEDEDEIPIVKKKTKTGKKGKSNSEEF